MISSKYFDYLYAYFVMFYSRQGKVRGLMFNLYAID